MEAVQDPRLDVDCSTVRGHFLATDEAALRVGVSAATLKAMPGVIKVAGSDGHRPTFPEFQFTDDGFVDGLRDVVVALDGALHGLALAAWVQASQPGLGGASVIDWLASGRDGEPLAALVATVTATDRAA